MAEEFHALKALEPLLSNVLTCNDIADVASELQKLNCISQGRQFTLIFSYPNFCIICTGVVAWESFTCHLA